MTTNARTASRLRVLLVIHGYPPRYNAGSELYTQQLAHGLADLGAEVAIFAREEDSARPDYIVSKEADGSVPVYLVNNPRSNVRVQDDGIDRALAQVMQEVRPDVVHFGHLNHLSVGLVQTAKRQGASVVFTLHDYWLMCPRGQFLQWGLGAAVPWALCDGQDDRKCATTCFNRYYTGKDNEHDAAYWTEWVARRMELVREAAQQVDIFLAPSRHIQRRHVRDFALPASKVEYLDYGFDRSRCRGATPPAAPPVIFGYVGRHHPSKGLPDLISAFARTTGPAKLRIWGHATAQLTDALKRQAATTRRGREDIEWMGPFEHESLGVNVYGRCHCLVVPSIWEENSPLVIHEAQEARVAVITAQAGGMAEYVQDGINGLLFKHRDAADLSRVMQNAIDDPPMLARLGKRGYLFSPDGSIPDFHAHAEEMTQIYSRVRGAAATVRVVQ